jgi:protoheme IX farnesyltransferase
MKRLYGDGTLSVAPPHARDFLALGKPELTLLSVLTALGGAYLGRADGASYVPLFWTFLGTLLVGAGAGALNMLLEWRYDAEMKRTERRPLPAGRVSGAEAATFGILCSAGGIVTLGLFTTLTAMLLASVTLVTYLMLYTPLKRLTPFATVVGAVPGALPPVIGWAATRGTIGLEGWGLFAILFFWQMPHFLSLSWMYRRDYERAGYRLLAVLDRDGSVIRRQILVFTAALLPASVFPTYIGMCGELYFAGASLLSIGFLLAAFRWVRPLSGVSARRLFLASLVYLPTLIFFMILDRVG